MELPVPTGVDPTYHWYEGVPPLTGVAEKVTASPSHEGFTLAEIETLTGSKGLTVMVTVFEVAGLPETQVSPDVITTLI